MRSSERRRAALLRTAVAFLLIGSPVVLTVGCGDETPPPEGRAEWPSELAAAVDSGNAAYRAGDYQDARRHFRAAARVAPEVGTAWFGVYMAERALGNEAAADSALRRVGELGDAARFHHDVPEAEDGDTAPSEEGTALEEDAGQEPASPRHRNPVTGDAPDG